MPDVEKSLLLLVVGGAPQLPRPRTRHQAALAVGVIRGRLEGGSQTNRSGC
jgi:hypothetical protein